MADVNATVPERVAGVLTAIAAAIVITAIAIVPFLTPAWVSFEQGRSGAPQLTGYSADQLRAATDAILADLVLGPPAFDVEIDGAPVLIERERAHMRDVRGVFAGFGLLALVAALALLALYAGARRLGHPERAWAAIRNGARGLAVGVVIAGVIAFFAFDALFEVFHRLFFAGGSYTFDPGTERLVQLFPFTFWSETTMAVGAVIVGLSLLVATLAGRAHAATCRAGGHVRGRGPPGGGAMSGVPVARLFGIEIRVHLSWIFIIAIITVTVGGRLGTLQPSADATLAWLIGAVASLGFLATVVAHELAHALVARRTGLMVDAISVHFIGSPATVDIRAATPRAEAAIALAGPVTSFALGVLLIAVAILGMTSGIEALQVVGDALFIIGVLDVVLAAVSIVPAFPLDGGRLVRAIVWARTGDERRGARAAGAVGRWVGWVLIAAGLVIILTGNTVDGIMVGLIGWFLGASARSVDRWVLLEGLISGVSVGEAMEPKLETITPQLTLDTFASQVLDGTLGPALPVIRDDQLSGWSARSSSGECRSGTGRRRGPST